MEYINDKTLKQVKKDIKKVYKIIENCNNDYTTIKNTFRKTYEEEDFFDFIYGDFCVFTYTKDNGLLDFVSIWDNDGICEDMEISKILRG